MTPLPRRRVLLNALGSPALAFAAASLFGTVAVVPAANAAERIVGSGRAATETRSLPEFQAIALRGSIDLVVRQGAATSVVATADDNLIALLETVVERAGAEDARLVVRWKSGVNISTKAKVQVQVVTPRLSAVAVAGSGDARVEALQTPSLKLSVAGSGNAALTGLKTDELTVSVSGSGDIKADGQAGRLKLSIAGSGDVMARDLKADEVTVSIAGSGDAAVHAQKKLAVTIAGSGDVIYSGEPEITRSVAGSGTLKKR
jgi:hypothetical protein